jgi:hypothetical protein
MATSAHHEQPNVHRSHLVSKLSPRSLFTATSLISGAFFTACFLSLAVAPEPTMAFLSYILHSDLTSISRPVNPGSFIVGLLAWSLGTGLYAALIARIYNRLLH